MKKIIFLFLSTLLFLVFLTGCETSKETTVEEKKVITPVDEKSVVVKEETQTELEETAIQIQEVDNNTKLEPEIGILVVRFLLEAEKENKLSKLPNFRIRGPQILEIDNSPTNIQQDAIHVLKLKSGKYYISSLYSIQNETGEYEFDKPFPNNYFMIEKGKINYIGDIKVRLEEEAKSENVFTRKLKLTLPANNDDTIKVLEDKLKDLLKQYELIRSIIVFK
ncbi:MAG TPA: hypothetical protein DHW82_06250 [Spirochaetia bacterium]|nr:MAG: hypothetical protein A2Y41_01325 [Spirochaetes bacterium GWB1_36_13]HCL56594.1 hypothetical protein [Spirochaetia bacterium]